MKRDFPLIVALLFGAGGFARAEEVKLKWESSQIFQRLGYYAPVRLDLSATKPAGVTKLPEGLKAPVFGTLKLGPRESATVATVVLDEPKDEPARLWIDRNGNGDLTDDPEIAWAARKGNTGTSWGGAAEVEAAYGAERRAMGIYLYRLEHLRNALMFYRKYGFTGEVALEGKSYPAVLVDDATTGDFRGAEGAGPGVRLLLDLNGDGKFDSRTERFNVRQPFAIGGQAYEVTGLTAAGGAFTIARTDKPVPEPAKPAETAKAPGPAPAVGGKPVVFEQKNLAGEPVHFPGDYQGKLVLLDFWATWCGPCLKEVPNVVKVYEEFQGQGFEILGVSLDSPDGLEKLPPFTKARGMAWPQVCDTKGWQSPIAALYGVRAIPSAFLVDGKSGTVVATGSELRGAQLRATVERCLAKLGAAPVATAPPVKTPQAVAFEPVFAKAAELRDAGQLLTADAFAAQQKNPQPAPVALVPAGTAPLAGREIARRAAAGYVRAGWYFQCTKCGQWHLQLAGSYAVAKDTVATAHHVMQPPENMKPGAGYPLLVRGETEVLPISAVLADDAAMDAIVLRAAVQDLNPLPLSGDVQTGDSVWCLSDPRGERGYFSTGIVNRFIERTVGDPRGRRINVSTDWAPGSSGSAVLDVAGNVVGHVATIRALFSKAQHPATDKPGDLPGPAAPAMNLHEAIPAKSVLTLIPR